MLRTSQGAEENTRKPGNGPFPSGWSPCHWGAGLTLWETQRCHSRFSPDAHVSSSGTRFKTAWPKDLALHLWSQLAGQSWSLSQLPAVAPGPLGIGHQPTVGPIRALPQGERGETPPSWQGRERGGTVGAASQRPRFRPRRKGVCESQATLRERRNEGNDPGGETACSSRTLSPGSLRAPVPYLSWGCFSTNS